MNGITALSEDEPSEAQLMRLTRAIAIIRGRLERWLRRKYLALFRRIRKELIALGTPTEEDIVRLEVFYTNQRQTILTRFYESLYPEAAGLLMDDDTAKGNTPPALEIKARLNIGILAWIRETVGNHLRIIDGNTPPLEDVRRMAWQADGNPKKFKQLMDDSNLWSNTGIEVRARRVAVTETTAGINNSMAKTSELLARGRKRVKTWHTSGMRNTRQAHEDVNGVTIPAEDFFELRDTYGGVAYLKYPGDNSLHADPALIINCRCFVTYRYAD